MISNRTMSCAFDILSDIPVAHTLSLLTQSGVSTFGLNSFCEPTAHFRIPLRETLLGIDGNSRIELCASIVELKQTLRNLTGLDYKFDERWSRFERSLAIDGYSIRGGQIINSDPIAEHLATAEKSLSELIYQSSILEADGIVTSIEKSAEDYLKQPPDLNGCLSNMRTALETLVKSLASKIQSACGETKDTSKWGNAVSYLRSKGFLSEKEESVLIATYALLSELHRPIQMDENEMVRFARSIALAICWLLSKKATYEKP